MKKLPHTVDTDELLKLINQSPAASPENTDTLPEVIEYKNDIMSFLSTFNIQEGDKRIKKNLLYSIYKAWSGDPCKRKDFILELSAMLPTSADTAGAPQFKINQNAVKLTYDVYTKYVDEYKVLKSKKYASHFEDFLNYFSLKSDGYWIELKLLYFLYDKYTFLIGYPGRILTLRHFEKFCTLHLKKKVTSAGKVYELSPNITNFFQPGQLERMKKEHAKERKKEISAKVPKKRSRASRSRSKVQSKNKN